MDAEKHLAEGNLEAALDALQQRVRERPADAKLRIFLFQLLAVLGRWDRALTQLNVAGEMDASNLMMTQAYREAIRCEMLRRRVFDGRTHPVIFGDPEDWIAHLVEALRLAAEGSVAASADFRQRAFEAAPTTAGALRTADDSTIRFSWIADADPRLGPVLEVVLDGKYEWVPFHRIRRIGIEAPEDLRDMVWLPAQFTWANAGQSVGLIPTRYPGSEESEDSMVRMARRTEWVDRGSDLFTGLGQRMIVTDEGEVALLDLRSVELETGAAGHEAADG